MIFEPLPSSDAGDGLPDLIRRFSAAEAALQARLAGQVDAVIDPKGGQPLLLYAAQRRLLVVEETLRKEAETQTAILNALPSHIAIVDPDGTITAVNAAWCRFAKANDLPGATYGVGRNYLQVCDMAQGDDADIAQAIAIGIRRVLGGEILTFSHEYPCHAINEKRWFLLTVTPISEDSRTGAVLAHTNITARKIAQVALQASEERYRTTFEKAAIGVSHVSVDGRFLQVNDALSAIVGYSRDELQRMTFFDLIMPEDRPRSEAGRTALLAGTQHSFTMEKRYRRKDGEVVWVNLVTSLVRSEKEEPYFISVIEDISGRKNAEIGLRHSQSMLSIASRIGRLGAWTLDLPSYAVKWSEEVRFILETALDYEPTIEAAINFYVPECRAQITGAIDACRYRGLPFDMELKVITAKGRRLWVRALGEAVRDDQGDIRGVHGAFQDISERRMAADAYRQVAERLSTTLESIAEPFCTVDRDWKFTYVNHQAGLFLHQSESDLLGKGLWEKFPDAVNTDIHGQFREAMEKNEAIHFQEYFPAYDAWYEVHGYPSDLGLAIHIRDVSDQRRDREALRISEERFRLLAKATDDAIWDLDLETKKMWRNEGFVNLFRYSRLVLEKGIDFWVDHIHADDRKRAIDSSQHAINTDVDRWAEEYRFRREDGSYADVSDRGYIIRNADGKAVRMIGGMNDVTARKQAEARIKEQAALLDEARDAISVLDLRHRLTYLNKSAVRLFGWSTVEAVGHPIRDLLFRGPTDFEHAMRETLGKGGWSGDLTLTTKDGRKLLTEARWTLMRDSAGLPHSILSICTDITESRKVEQQLLRVQRLESIGTLAGGIAHDLNNVLTPILLSINLLMRGEKDEKRLRTLSVIDSSARHGAEMVKQVLSFARGVEGNRLTVQIPDLLRDIEKIINDTFLKGIQVRVAIAPDVWNVTGDATQLHQVLLNLCVNARDAMPNGGFIILSAENKMIDENDAKLMVEAKPGAHVVIGVEDTGTGMTPEIIEKIFEPFYTTKDIGAGTGLGLSTSLAVVKGHGGFLRVCSEPGKGTSFKIYLPSLARSKNEPVISEEAPLPRGNGELVMVVDDESSVRQLTRQTLEEYGYRVLLAADGSDAIALFATQQDSIALVLTDIMMPIIDGLTISKVMMKMRPSVRIIAASGLNGNQVTAKTVGSGIKHFLAKPYTTESLILKIHEALQQP